jgi:anti-sigma factor (TIGR02949 family)
MSTSSRDISCHEALEHLYEYLDHELTPEVEAEVRGHLVACVVCTSRFGFEEVFLKFLEAKSQAQGASPELRRRILERLFLDPDVPER